MTDASQTPPAEAQRVTMQMLLKAMVEQHASDLHISAGSPPQLRVDGKLMQLRTPPLTPADTKQLCYSVLSEPQRARFEESNELDLSFGVKNLARFRANIFCQRGSVAGAFRQIPFQIKSLDDLGLPPTVGELARKPRGLVLITGPTGAGKSTTLAALVDQINTERQGHIVTIEDPIEYVHNHRGCLVTQRELGQDTKSFKNALKFVLRQDPDVVLIGELRDLETIEAALSIAETGHLTFGTLHTNSAMQTINRIIDVFPPHQQAQVRTQLSFVLEAVLCQTLLPKIGGGRVLASELITMNHAMRLLIREDKIHQIPNQMQMGRGRTSMYTLNHSLSELVATRKVKLEDALAKSSDPDELKKLLGQPTGGPSRPA
jgi:twitching motility protein PilT